MDKILYKNKFVALVERDGYTFLHEIRSDGLLISIIPFRLTMNGIQYLARIEVCPAHGNTPELCSITGGIDHGKTPRQMAQIELLEEGGYRVNEDNLIDLGQVRPSKSSDTTVYLFSVELTDIEQGIAIGDGSRLEAESSTQWVTYEMGIEIQDPLFVTGMVKLNKRLNIK